MSDASRIVGKLWSYCHVLRDDGLSYADYLEQLTYLLFLKMADEQTRPPWSRPSPVPQGYDWPSLVGLDGAALESHYRELLEHLGRQHGLLGLVFRKAQNKVQDPAKLKRLVSDLIDREQWVSLGADLKGDAYEGLLERNAQDSKTGAGPDFTPRPPPVPPPAALPQPRPGLPATGAGRHTRPPRLRHRRLPARRPPLRHRHAGGAATPHPPAARAAAPPAVAPRRDSARR